MTREFEPKKQENLQFTDYQKFGFSQLESGKWAKELAGTLEVFEIVDWTDIPTLEEITNLQQTVWGMSERDAVPSNLLAIAGDTGGNVIAAKNSNGEIEGFVLTMGVTDGTLFLHMIGVDPNNRYKKDLGWNLSVLQLLVAKGNGIKKIVWTYDPMRGSNARLNLEKLGAVVQKYTVNKYGKQNNELYGESPTDRFTAEWNINDPRVLSRLNDINRGKYTPQNLSDVSDLPVLNDALVYHESTPNRFLVEIPYDIDILEEREKIAWRTRLRVILTSILSTEQAHFPETNHEYEITGFATGQLTEEVGKQSFYIVTRKKSDEQNS